MRLCTLPWVRFWTWTVLGMVSALTFSHVKSIEGTSQRSFLESLRKEDRFVQIQSSVTNKFLSIDPGEELTNPSTVALDVSLIYKEPLEVWRIHQTVGFRRSPVYLYVTAFRDGKFSPVYKISSQSSTNVPSQLSQILWSLQPSPSNREEYQFVKPYEAYKCLSEEMGSQVITLGLCNDTTTNTLWKITTVPLS